MSARPPVLEQSRSALDEPNSGRCKGSFDFLAPATIRSGIGGARMQDSDNPHPAQASARFGGAFFGKAADSDHAFYAKQLHEFTQGRVARLVQGLAFCSGQLIRSAVLTRCFHEATASVGVDLHRVLDSHIKQSACTDTWVKYGCLGAAPRGLSQRQHDCPAHQCLIQLQQHGYHGAAQVYCV